MQFVPKTIVSEITKAFKGEKDALAKAIAKQDESIQKALDAVTLACDKPKALFLKGNAKTNPARAEIKALFYGLHEAGYIEENTAKQYQSCFWIAFEKGIPWARNLANKKSAENTASGTATSDKPKAGKVEVTDMPALTATLQKALHQCTLLNQTMLKGALLDAIVEFIPEFTETAK